MNENRGILLGLIAVLMFSLTLPVTRLIIDDFDPIFIGLGRAVVAASLAGLMLWHLRAPWPNQRQFFDLLITAFGVVIGFPVLSAWAMQSVDASHGGIMLGLLPLMTALISVFIAHERPSAGFWVAAIAGSALVVMFALLKGQGEFQLGDFALFGAIVSAAVGYAMGGKLAREMPGWMVICWALLLASPFIVIPAYLTLPAQPLSISLQSWAGFLYLALFSQLFGFFLWNKGLAIGGIARVSQTQLLQPFFTLGFSSLILSEIIDAQSILFAIVVVVVVAIGKRMPIHQRT